MAFTGNVDLESIWFPDSPLDPEQASGVASLAVSPGLFFEASGRYSFTLATHLRYDNIDQQRTYIDVRKAYFLIYGSAGTGDWELRIGMDRVFWGVTEFTSLVDTVNQVDLVDNPDEKSRLGQPMAYLTWTASWGVTEFLLLPYHRQRTFPGRHGRNRLPLLVDNKLATYDASRAERRVDAAVRFSNTYGPIDLGVSFFNGNSREPFLSPSTIRDGVAVFAPHYNLINQLGVDVQFTLESTLVKLEAIRRTDGRTLDGSVVDYTACTAGVEHTLYALGGSSIDLGIFLERSYDQRRRRATSKSQDDLFVGFRFAFNDVQSTELTMTWIEDLDFSNRLINLLLNRRISDRWSLEATASWVERTDQTDWITYSIRQDSQIRVEFSYGI